MARQPLLELQRSAGIVDALFSLLPTKEGDLARLRGGVWVGVGASDDGALRLRLYANNEWGDELARWRRVTDALRRLDAAGFARFLRASVADLTRCFSPAGLAVSLARRPVLKLYLRPRQDPWQACARLVKRSELGLPPQLWADIDRALGVPLSSLNQRALMLSIGGAADGSRTDVKLDLNGQHLFDGAEDRLEAATEALASMLGVDAAPYRTMLAIVRSVAASGCTPAHDYLGVGGSARDLRLNVYLRPAVTAAR